MTLRKAESIFFYFALPVSLLMEIVGFETIHATTRSWPPLTITEKRNPPGRFILSGTDTPGGKGSCSSANVEFPEWFYDRAQVGDELVSGLCHMRLVRGRTLIGVDVQWIAVPFLGSALLWFTLLCVLLSKPTLLHRAISGCARVWTVVGCGYQNALACVGMVARIEETRTDVTEPPPTAPSREESRPPVERLKAIVTLIRTRKWRLRDLRYLGLATPYFVPAMFDRLYQPINESITVRQFGCGCPPLDGSSGFNANDFNVILWLVLFAVCTRLWVCRLERTFPQCDPFARGLVGGAGISLLLLFAAHFLLAWGLAVRRLNLRPEVVVGDGKETDGKSHSRTLHDLTSSDYPDANARIDPRSLHGSMIVDMLEVCLSS
jgi:hypothetical protein